MSTTPLLDQIDEGGALKALSYGELKQLAEELRRRIIDVLSVTGGHLSSNLGIVELTLALHCVFESPKDRLLFDVGHQSYVHKLLTGRNSRFPSLRQTGGLSGFLSPSESPHDHFYSGHAGNTLSLALGMAKARDLLGGEEHVVPILGDAALTCGLTLEGMNNIPRKLKNFTLVLNDNAMSISKNVGAITAILSRFFNSPTANHIYEELSRILSKIPGCGEAVAEQGHRVKESLKNLISTAPFFEQFGLSYVGPIDGHDVKKLIETLEAVKGEERPTLIHVLTVKGQGMQNAIEDPTPYHGAKPFDRETGAFHQSKSASPSFPQVFGEQMVQMGEEDPHLLAITPAMPVGSCLTSFMRRFPSRCVDVGIAEGHALTYAGGIAKRGELKVVATLYSSFLQRAFDNIYHDICIQNSPVVIAIDRAGLATGDGVTAQGLYDIPFLNALPNMVVAQPRDGQLLKELLTSAFEWKQPTAIRYPNLPTERGAAPLKKRELGRGELLKEGKEGAIVALGHMAQLALEVAKRLEEEGVEVAVIDPIFVKPLDRALLIRHLKEARFLVTLEEHALEGGLGTLINSLIAQEGLSHLWVKNFGIPDKLIGHGSHKALLEECGMSVEAILDSLPFKVASL